MNSIQLVTTPGCTHCAQVRKVIEEVKPQFSDILVEEIDATTPKGTELVMQHMIFASPGVIINGELFSTGGINKDELIKKLGSLKTP